MRPRPFTILFLVAALGGLLFLSYATFDFAQHLDRQTHELHCSWNPLMTKGDLDAESGCHVTMMSRYSSIFRNLVWGGIPVSLPGMAVFAFLIFRGLDLWLNGREGDKAATLFLVSASAVPVLTSAVMGYISLVELDAACKLCIGTYASSALTLVGAIGAWRSAAAPRLGEDIGLAGQAPELDAPAGGSGSMGILVGFATLGGFVLLPTLTWLVLAPDFSRFVGSCGSLSKPEDTYGIMFDLDDNVGGKQAVEVFDPLCPFCKALEADLESSGLGEQLHRKAVLFPLDNTCNWNLGYAVHPGACTISEAVLCAEGRSGAVIDWAFEHQQEILAATKADPKAAEAMVVAAFPDVKGCLGTPPVKIKLRRSIQYAVANSLPVSTPQLFVEGTRLCDEDSDIGLDWMLSRILANPKPAAGPQPGTTGATP